METVDIHTINIYYDSISMSTKKWVEAHPEKIAGYKRTYYAKNKGAYRIRRKAGNDAARARAKAFIAKVKTPCVKCKELEQVCIDFHHVDPALKKYSVAAMVNTGFSIRLITEEIEKCVCLCSNCHRKLHAGLLKLEGDSGNAPDCVGLQATT